MVVPLVFGFADDACAQACRSEELARRGGFEEDAALVGDVHPHVRPGPRDEGGGSGEEDVDSARVGCLGVDASLRGDDDGDARARGQFDEVFVPVFLPGPSQGRRSSSRGPGVGRAGAIMDSWA